MGRLVVRMQHAVSFAGSSYALRHALLGAYRTALECLRRDQGGWLHVHANVGTAELQPLTSLATDSGSCRWAQMLQDQLAEHAVEMEKSQSQPVHWTFAVRHVEKVKSYAPKIFHVVADVEARPRVD